MSSVFNSRSTVKATTGCITQDVTLAQAVSLGNGIVSDVSPASGATAITNIVRISESDYNSLADKDASTLYIVTADPV